MMQAQQQNNPQVHFAHTIGQENGKASLSNAVREGVFPQGLLIHGIPGVGQHSFLCDLAAVLLCDSKELRPCGTCVHCLERMHRSRDNILPIFPQEEAQQKKEDTRKAENQRRWELLLEEPYGMQRRSREHISIAQVRDLKERLSYTETSGRKRVILIFWPESMMEAAANALLKILEEPPKDTYFLLSCENRTGVLNTILSRCIQIGLPSLSAESMVPFLESRQKMELNKWVPAVQGSPGRLLGLEQVGCESVLNSAGECIQKVLESQTELQTSGIMDSWMTFSDWLEEQWFVEDVKEVESVEWVFTTMLEILRVLQKEVKTDVEKKLLGSLSLPLSMSLEHGEVVIQFINRVLSSIRQYVRPPTAILASYFGVEQEWVELENKVKNKVEEGVA